MALTRKGHSLLSQTLCAFCCSKHISQSQEAGFWLVLTGKCLNCSANPSYTHIEGDHHVSYDGCWPVLPVLQWSSCSLFRRPATSHSDLLHQTASEWLPPSSTGVSLPNPPGMAVSSGLRLPGAVDCCSRGRTEDMAWAWYCQIRDVPEVCTAFSRIVGEHAGLESWIGSKCWCFCKRGKKNWKWSAVKSLGLLEKSRHKLTAAWRLF